MVYALGQTLTLVYVRLTESLKPGSAAVIIQTACIMYAVWINHLMTHHAGKSYIRDTSVTEFATFFTHHLFLYYVWMTWSVVIGQK